MAIEFNKFGQYNNNYGIQVAKESSSKAHKAKEEKEVNEVKAQTPEFKGLENETDLLTKNVQNIYGLHIAKNSTTDKAIADNTNEILASLGYENYKVTAAQVASVAGGVNNVVLPGLRSVEENAVAANIADPNGPFADLFA